MLLQKPELESNKNNLIKQGTMFKAKFIKKIYKVNIFFHVLWVRRHKNLNSLNILFSTVAII